MFNPQHYGLTFTPTHVKNARDQRDKEPFRSAWALLGQRKQLDLLELAQWCGLNYRFNDDLDSGERAVNILNQDDLTPPSEPGVIEMSAALMVQAQCFELVRDHPAWKTNDQQAWSAQFSEAVNQSNQPQVDLLYVDSVWLNALMLVAGIVLEDETLFYHAVQVFQDVINQDIHPEGYIRKAAQGEPGTSLNRMLLTTQALILTAEAATHAGENLWTYNVRGVSALTPTPYLLYYYYYPEKWRWDADLEADEIPETDTSGLDIESTQALYRRHGGLWEMAQHQNFSKDREMLLNDLRPVYDVWGGGLVTLTHGSAAHKSRRFGVFG